MRDVGTGLLCLSLHHHSWGVIGECKASSAQCRWTTVRTLTSSSPWTTSSWSSPSLSPWSWPGPPSTRLTRRRIRLRVSWFQSLQQVCDIVKWLKLFDIDKANTDLCFNIYFFHFYLEVTRLYTSIMWPIDFPDENPLMNNYFTLLWRVVTVQKRMWFANS